MPGREVVQQHLRDGHVVVELRLPVAVEHDLVRALVDLGRDDPLGPRRRRTAPLDLRRQPDLSDRQRDRDQARQDHQEREEHLGHGGDQRRAPRRGHRVGRHRPLHDQEVGAPVAEREHEARAPSPGRTTRRPAGWSPALPMPAPGVREASAGTRSRCNPAQPPTSLQPEEHQRQEAGDDQEELQHLVVDRAGQPAEVDVAQHDQRRRG